MNIPRPEQGRCDWFSVCQQHRRPVIRLFSLILSLLLSLTTLATLAFLYKPMDPVGRGNSAEFWMAACGVDIGGAHGLFFESAMLENGRASYSTMGFHGTLVYSLPEEEALKFEPAVISELERIAKSPDDDDWRKRGYARWKGLRTLDVSNLILCMEDAREQYRLNKLARESPENVGSVRRYADLSAGLHIAVQKRQNYWMNFVFEGLFLIGMIWFALWPAIRALSLKRYLLHLFLIPTLLMLPTWMGYCSFWHPNVRPSGGILYPWIIALFHNDLPNYGFERPYRYLPQILFPMSQWDTWTLDDAFAARTFIRLPPGLLQTLLAGCLLTALHLFIRFAVRFELHRFREARLRRPGFEVLPPIPSNTTVESSPPAPPPAPH